MEGVTISKILAGVCVLSLIFLAPTAVLVWALIDLKRPVTMAKALTKTALGVAIAVGMSRKGFPFPPLFLCLGAFVALVGASDLAALRRIK